MGWWIRLRFKAKRGVFDSNSVSTAGDVGMVICIMEPPNALLFGACYWFGLSLDTSLYISYAGHCSVQIERKQLAWN